MRKRLFETNEENHKIGNRQREELSIVFFFLHVLLLFHYLFRLLLRATCTMLGRAAHTKARAQIKTRILNDEKKYRPSAEYE